MEPTLSTPITHPTRGFTALEARFARERPEDGVDAFAAVLHSVLGRAAHSKLTH